MAKVKGTSSNETLFGSSDFNFITLKDTENSDTIWGYGGNDTIYGSFGTSPVAAGKDDDLIYGGSGNDVVYTGEGLNTVYGGDGDDAIHWNPIGLISDERDAFFYGGGWRRYFLYRRGWQYPLQH